MTFSDSYTLEVGGERVELAWHGPNHTPDNIYIHFPGHDTLMFIDVVNAGWVPIYNANLSEDVPGYMAAPPIALSYPWTHLISGHLGRLATRDDVAVHQAYIADIEASANEALASPRSRSCSRCAWTAGVAFLPSARRGPRRRRIRPRPSARREPAPVRYERSLRTDGSGCLPSGRPLSLTSECGGAAVDDQSRAGDVAGGRAGEEDDGRRELLWIPGPGPMTRPQACSTIARVASRRSARRAASTTSAPASASALANATPRPEEAPVTIATLPSRRKRSSAVVMSVLSVSFLETGPRPAGANS